MYDVGLFAPVYLFITLFSLSFVVIELEEPDYDYQLVGGTGVCRAG